MNRAPLVVLSLLVLWSTTAKGQDLYEIRQTVVQPLRHYVGTPVVVRLRIAISPAAEDRTLRTPEELPTHPMIDINRIEVTPREDFEYDVTIAVTPFLPGSNRLPPLDLGAITLSDVRVDTSSILKDEPPRPTLGPLVLPGTWRRVTLALTSLLLAPLLAFRAVRGVRQGIARIEKLRRRRIPINRLLRVLRRLKREAAQPASVEVVVQRRLFTVLTRAVRGYLEGRFGLAAQTATTIELKRLLSQLNTPPAVDAKLLQVLSRADLIKFGGVSPEDQEATEVLGEVEQIALQYEEAIGVSI